MRISYRIRRHGYDSVASYVFENFKFFLSYNNINQVVIKRKNDHEKCFTVFGPATIARFFVNLAIQELLFGETSEIVAFQGVKRLDDRKRGENITRTKILIL